MRASPKWIAVEWAATHVRVWAMGANNKVLAEVNRDYSTDGPDLAGLESALLGLISEWLTPEHATPVICCGMTRLKTPWRAVPCVPVDPHQLVRMPTQDARLDVRVIPGIMQRNPSDMMFGTETLIAGFLALRPGFDGVICLPGAHSRWVHISAREIVSFATYLTGELLALLAKRSSISPSIADNGLDNAAFDQAVATGLSHPASVSARLYSLHASVLNGDLDAVSARSTLSGLLIGQELGAARPYWLGQNVVVEGTVTETDMYVAALRTQGAEVERLASEVLALEGLKVAYEKEDVK